VNESSGTKGAFIVFEGPEGAGKSTQVARTASHLTARGYDVLVTREPGGTEVGDRIREVLLDPSLAVDPLTEFLLYAAARTQHVRDRIAPALAAGTTVICDRFAASSVAYQGYGRALDRSFVRYVNGQAVGDLEADRTILLDLPAAAGLARVAARGNPDRLERADLDFHERVRAGFLQQAADAPRWTVIDAGRDVELVAADVWIALSPLFPEGGPGAP